MAFITLPVPPKVQELGPVDVFKTTGGYDVESINDGDTDDDECDAASSTVVIRNPPQLVITNNNDGMEDTDVERRKKRSSNKDTGMYFMKFVYRLRQSFSPNPKNSLYNPPIINSSIIYWPGLR